MPLIANKRLRAPRALGSLLSHEEDKEGNNFRKKVSKKEKGREEERHQHMTSSIRKCLEARSSRELCSRGLRGPRGRNEERKRRRGERSGFRSQTSFKSRSLVLFSSSRSTFPSSPWAYQTAYANNRGPVFALVAASTTNRVKPELLRRLTLPASRNRC